MTVTKIKPTWDRAKPAEDRDALIATLHMVRSPKGLAPTWRERLHSAVDTMRFHHMYVLTEFETFMQQHLPNCQYECDAWDGFPRASDVDFTTRAGKGEDVFGLELDADKEPIIRFSQEASAMMFKLAWTINA